MACAQTCLHLEGSPYTVHDTVTSHLLLQLEGKARWKGHLAGYHVHRLQPRLACPLSERLHRLDRDDPVVEVQLHAQVLEREVYLVVWIGEVGEEGEVAIQVRGGVDVDGVEACGGQIQRGVPRLDDEEDDERDDPREDEEKTEDDAHDRTTPYQGARFVAGLEEVLHPRSRVVELRQRWRLQRR